MRWLRRKSPTPPEVQLGDTVHVKIADTTHVLQVASITSDRYSGVSAQLVDQRHLIVSDDEVAR